MEENKDLQTPETNAEETVTETPATTKEVHGVICPHCQQAFDVEIERPVTTGTVGRRGKLSGLKIEEMTDDQLKVELINSKSVLYKAKKRGAAADIIAKNEERVNAAEAEKAKRDAVKAADKVATTTETAETTETTPESEIDQNTSAEDDTVYNESVENEI